MKLVEVMACVDRVAKNGTNTTQHYKYAMAADVYDAVRSELAKRFVLMVPHIEKSEFAERKTNSGGQMTICTMFVRFDFTDAQTGEVVSVASIGQGSDTLDKASYKAMTGATKQCLIQTFLIPTGDDPENEKAAPKAPPPAGMEALKARAKSAPPSPPAASSIASAAQRAADEPPPPDDNDAPPDIQAASPSRPAHVPTAPPTHDRLATFGFGSGKGKPLADLDDKSLGWYAQCLNRDLADASKSKWHEKTRAQLANLTAEIRYRGL